MANRLKNLLVYDNLQVAGGAEYVTKVMLAELPFEQLLVNYAEVDVVKTLGFDESDLTTLSKPIRSAPLSMLSSAYKFWRYKDEIQYDTVLVSGIFAPLIARNVKARQILYYCHTPPRFLYDLKPFYKKSLGSIQWFLLRSFSVLYKRLYEDSFKHIDKVIVNSKNVQTRLSTYLDVESTVIYPPCDTSYEGNESQGYFLSTARLEPYKRVDLIVDAFMRMPDKQLIVMSGGSMFDALKSKAKGCDNIHFTDWVDEHQKRTLIGHCEATIYIPENEDFGMSPVESVSACKPVIGVNEGGLKETIKHKKNGYLCETNSLIDEICKATEFVKQLNTKNIHSQALKFDKAIFLAQLGKILLLSKR